MKGAFLMKKSDLWIGVCFLIAGTACLVGALMLSGTALGSLLCGLTGGIGVPGLVMVCKYLKWSSPKHAAEYRERLEQEQIELRDERKEMLRNKSGRYAYVFNLLVNCLALFVLASLDALKIVEIENLIILGLALWLLAQYFAGIVFYKILEKKY